jgi:PAS domain S-box-containing protein
MNLQTIFLDGDSLVWIGGSEGLYKFDRRIKKDYLQPFHTVIRKISKGEDKTTILLGHTNNDLNNIIGPPIKYSENTLRFEYACIFFEDELSNQYSYRLNGEPEKWSTWSSETIKEFTNLREGKYIFEVKGRNIYGIESTTDSFSFRILPPWYRSFWAYCLYFMLLVLLIILIVHLNIKRLKVLNTRLEKTIKERTIEIHEKNIELEQQNEEIKAQHEYLGQKNIILEQKNDEIQSQADKIIEYSHELEKLSIVASEIDNAVIIMDKQGDFVWVNKGFTRLYGYSLSDYGKKFGKNIYESSSNSDIKEIIENCISSKKPVNYDSFFISDNGTKKWLKTTITPILDSDNNISKLIAIDSDISDIKEAYKIIETQNQQITGSIRYAQTIQQAILPTKESINKIGENFIIYKPKDIVSGDFYWLVEIYLKTDEFEKLKIIKSDELIENSTNSFQIAGFSNSQIYLLAMVDCTGHGVPGAFMSMIVNRLLNEIVVEMKIFSPAKILDNLKEKIKKALKQEESGNTDGMDINLCCLKKISETQTELIFSGAKSPLYYYQFEKRKIEILKADRITIGGAKYSVGKFFTEQFILLNSGDYIFMFTDGIIDQPNIYRKKFGSSKLLRTLEQNINLTLEQQKLELEKSILGHIQNQEQRDDMTFIGIKIS